ncbi:hypothetical protein Pla52o_14710 [Novipirellula galeiformis]|uniref:Uncharacterized protein n=1 Tax=Novipirellula galeiformis TaxID=2528004 RepID=A0A5C6CJY5_9BACT|nr:hypothetical protein Pla52o_14710 [Novipirellula galeiformis]
MSRGALSEWDVSSMNSSIAFASSCHSQRRKLDRVSRNITLAISRIIHGGSSKRRINSAHQETGLPIEKRGLIASVRDGCIRIERNRRPNADLDFEKSLVREMHCYGDGSSIEESTNTPAAKKDS